NPDTAAAHDLVRKANRLAESIVIEGPEYAAIPNIPKKSIGNLERAAACGVRVRFRYRDGGRTTNDDWIVWVTSDHKAIDWSGNADGDNWRQYVHSLAKK